MATSKLRGTDWQKLGYPEGRAITPALDILPDWHVSKLAKGRPLALLQKIKDDLYAYLRTSL